MKRILFLTMAALVGLAIPAYAAVNFVQKDTGVFCFEFLSGVTNTQSWCWEADADLVIDDGTTDSPTITLQDATDETTVITKLDGSHTTIAIVAADALQVLTGNFRVGNGTPGETHNGEDLYVEGISEFDGTANFDGAVDFDGTFDFSAALSGNADITILTPGDLIVGNGVPSVTQNGEDAYVEGTFEVDGAVEFDGAIDIDSTITVGTTAINTATLTSMARTTILVCGDATTVNANTVYYGPSQAVITSATVGQMTCNTTAAGNVTEATADEPAIQTTAFYPLGMVCYQADGGVTISYTLRSAEAAITPAITLSIADNILSGAATATATTAVASAATLAVAVASASDVATANVPFICSIDVAY